ncbi:MAG: ABC transporter permease [Bacillota bacterium]
MAQGDVTERLRELGDADGLTDIHGLSIGQRFWRRLVKNRLGLVGLIVVIVVIMMAILAPLLTPYTPREQDLLRRLEPPSRDHIMGIDHAGRDMFSRIAFGARTSLMIGVVGATGGMVIGVALGMLAGYFGGTFDNMVMRLVDVMMSFPGILLAILIVSVLGPGLNNLMVALVIWFVPTFARITRGNVLSLREMDYVEAARSLGASSARIITRHIMLNVLSPIIVYFTLSVATSILTAAGMGFLGLGVQPPTPEWGAMASVGRQYLRDAPHVILFPGLAIFTTVLSINVVGDVLRDVLDPRLKT